MPSKESVYSESLKNYRVPAVGLDNVPSRLLHDAADAIVAPVTHIVNISITNEIVPAAFKDAKVVPVFKKSIRPSARPSVCP